MQTTTAKIFMTVFVVLCIVAPFHTEAASTSKFCAQLDTQKKEQLTKVAVAKKSILEKESKAADALLKRNDLFVASATNTIATQKDDIASLVNELSSIATTDEEILIVQTIASTTSDALSQKEASTTDTLASTTKSIIDAGKKRGELIDKALTTYEQSIKLGFDNATANCASEQKTALASAKLDTETKTAKAELQKSELQAKIITDNIELTYADAKLKLSSYDKDFAKVLNNVQTTIKKTFTEE